MSKADLSKGSSEKSYVIRKATLEDLNAILDLAAGIFFQQSGEWYANRSWYRFVPGKFDPGEFFVGDADGKIVGLAAFRSFTLRVPGNEVPWVGVGSVCTAPECRGRGIMGGMLRAGIQDTDERGIPVGILWGDRARYGHFGWEDAGRQIELGVSLRHFTIHSGKTAMSSWENLWVRAKIPSGLRILASGWGVSNSAMPDVCSDLWMNRSA